MDHKAILLILGTKQLFLFMCGHTEVTFSIALRPIWFWIHNFSPATTDDQGTRAEWEEAQQTPAAPGH